MPGTMPKFTKGDAVAVPPVVYCTKSPRLAPSTSKLVLFSTLTLYVPSFSPVVPCVFSNLTKSPSYRSAPIVPSIVTTNVAPPDTSML